MKRIGAVRMGGVVCQLTVARVLSQILFDEFRRERFGDFSLGEAGIATRSVRGLGADRGYTFSS